MRKLFLLYPEVAGSWGGNTIITERDEIDGRVCRPRTHQISHLHYIFDGWLGDEILESCPCYIVTQSLANSIRQADFTGVRFENVEVSKSDLFLEVHPHLELPKFYWLIPEGKVELENEKKVHKWSGHDFCIDEKDYLVVSEKALRVLKQHQFKHCEVKEVEF